MYPTKANPSSIRFEEWDEPVWNPDIHLAVQPPKNVILFDKEGTFPTHSVPCPAPKKAGCRSQMAYSEPFQYLSKQGVRDLRRVVDHNMKFSMEASDGRIPLSLREMGYRSKFIRGMNTCQRTRALLSTLAGVEVVPSTMETTWGHTNVGIIGRDKPVDQWHIDSVPFVLVILLSDMSGAEGGKLEVVKKTPYQAAFQRIRETDNHVPPEEVLVVDYPTQGCAIFMQGSHMVHHVSPVFEAKERRITVVNSYQPVDPFYPDDTRMDFFKYDPETCYYQFARHRAIRAKLRLEHFLNNPTWISDPVPLAKELKAIAEELDDSVKLLIGLKDDKVPFYNEGGGMMMMNAKM